MPEHYDVDVESDGRPDHNDVAVDGNGNVSFN